MQSNILLIYTGGTIGMAKDYADQSLRPFDFDKLLNQIPELSLIDCKIDYHSFEKPIDSSDMQPKHWIRLAELIFSEYETYDGFVVLHGTDTMAYTASALSFMLKNLSKPVIFTGSQLPIGDLRTDAKENLITSIHFASLKNKDLPFLNEVCIYFEYKLFRANRTTKYNAENFDAFVSPNYPNLGISGVHMEIKEEYLRKKPKKPFKINTNLDSSVVLLKIFPGMLPNYIEQLLKIDCKAIILEAYGTGNVLSENWFLEALRTKTSNGTFLIVNTQCPAGTVELGRYETSRALLDMHAISSFDLTMEAAITKTIYLLGQNLNFDSFKLKYEKNLRGEML